MRREASSRSYTAISGILTGRSRNRAKQSLPTQPAPWHNSTRAQALNFDQKYEEALNILCAIPLETNPAKIGQEIAWALFNLGRTEEASALLEQLLRDYPEDSG